MGEKEGSRFLVRKDNENSQNSSGNQKLNPSSLSYKCIYKRFLAHVEPGSVQTVGSVTSGRIPTGTQHGGNFTKRNWAGER